MSQFLNNDGPNNNNWQPGSNQGNNPNYQNNPNRGNQFNNPNQGYSPNQPNPNNQPGGGLRTSTPNFQHNVNPNQLQPIIQTPQVIQNRNIPTSQPPVLNRGSNPSFGSISLGNPNQLPVQNNNNQLRGSAPDLERPQNIPTHLQPTQQQINRHSSPNYGHNNNHQHNNNMNNQQPGFGGPQQHPQQPHQGGGGPNYQPGARSSMGNPGAPRFPQSNANGVSEKIGNSPSLRMETSSTSKWITVLEHIPSLFAHSAVAVNEHLLVFGGFSGSVNKNTVMLLHTTATKQAMPPKPHFFQIKVRGDVPDVKERAAMVAIGKFVYIMGGYSRLNDAYYNSVHIFDSESLTFQNIPLQGEFPSPRCGHCCVELDGIIYVFGGRVKAKDAGTFGIGNVEYKNDVYAFNTISQQWRLVHTRGIPPQNRAMASATLVGRKIYVFGGAHSSGIKDTTAFCDIYSLDLDTLEWNEIEVKSTLPLPCYGHTMTYIGNNRLLAFGGKGYQVTNHIQVFDLNTNEWKEYSFGGNRLLKRWGHTATLHHGNMLILYGGKGDDINVYWDSIEIIDIDKELIEKRPEDIQKSKDEDQKDIQEWSKKSLQYLQIDIEELGSIVGAVVEGVLEEQLESQSLHDAMKTVYESKKLLMDRTQMYKL